MPPSRHVRNSGCWTCRLRRKRCDAIFPICGDCDSLKIGCRYGSKPVWMDSGDRQKQVALSLKEEIKRNGAQKRERAKDHNKAPTGGLSSQQYNVISDIMVTNDSSVPRSTVARKPKSDTLNPRSREALSYEPTLIATLPWSHQQHQRSDTLEQASASEWNFVMKYLDFVFPAFFPFYRPHIFDTGRSWLLLLLRKSSVAYHAALGLACYHFTIALSDTEEGVEHSVCKQLRWEEVERETKRCFDSLRADIVALNLNSRGMLVSIQQKVELMNSITQVLIFEMSIGRSAPWDTHLSAAITLFEQIMANPEAHPMYRGQSQSKFASVLLGISDPLWTNPGPSNHIWSAGQTGFRFCAGLLIFIDTMASTALGETPRLIRYHSDLLSELDDGLPVVGEAEIRLSGLVGCHNWVVRSIAEVSAVISYKRANGFRELPNIHVDDCASKIAVAQKSNIRIVQRSLAASATSYPDYQRDHSLVDLTPLDLGPNPSTSSIATLIWGLAAEMYCLTVTVGWDLSNSELMTNCAHIVGLLENVPLDQLRTLAWPICVSGCFAPGHKQRFFQALFTKLGKVHTAGALNDARELMEKVWQNKSTLEGSDLDLASGWSFLGASTLLV